MNSAFSDAGMIPEEPWEADISSALAGLPPIDPPEGFIGRAIDHRPLFALRALVASVAIVVLGFGASLAVGAFGRPLVVPELGALSAQHAVTQAGIFTDREAEGFVIDESAEAPLSTSSELDLRATLIAEEDLRQAVYARGGESISVFSQPGRVKFDELPGGERVMIDGVLAWVADKELVVVLETADSAVTVMGLTAAEVELAVEDIPRMSNASSVTRVLNTITRELGFPDVD